jgi:hypothetical protein
MGENMMKKLIYLVIVIMTLLTTACSTSKEIYDTDRYLQVIHGNDTTYVERNSNTFNEFNGILK